MCRVFGFKSVFDSQVHHSLVGAENALASQSVQHPDGWGVAYYVEGSPHVIKSDAAAVSDSLFGQVSGVVTSQTVLAHIRSATQGSVNILNTHPFQYGKWVFAHNGNIKGFEKSKYLSKIHPNLQRFVLGNTDSEWLFYFLMSYIIQGDHSANSIQAQTKIAVNELIALFGRPHEDSNGPPHENYYSFILTDGNSMLGYQGGKPLNYSSHKTKCSERDRCTFFNPSCETAKTSGQVNHLILSSEPLSGENIWLPLKMGQMISIDENMNMELLTT